MAKTGGWAKKLNDKSKANATKFRLGSNRAVISRTTSSHHEKVVALEYHKRLIQDHAINLGCRVTDLTKDGKKQGVTFRGDGLPDDSIQTPKVEKVLTEEQLAKAAEKAAEKALRYRGEMVEGWKPRRRRRYGYGSGCAYRPHVTFIIRQM